MTKRIIKISVALLLLFVIMLLFVCRTRNDRISAKDWIVKKYELIDQFSTYSSNLDDVVSVYAVGAMDMTDLQNEMYMARAQFDIMKKLYDQDLEDHPIKTGTHTYETKLGKEGLEKIWSGYDALLTEMERISKESGSADDLAYAYMGYRGAITDGLLTYMSVYYAITDPSKVLENTYEAQSEIGVQVG